MGTLECSCVSEEAAGVRPLLSALLRDGDGDEGGGHWRTACVRFILLVLDVMEDMESLLQLQPLSCVRRQRYSPLFLHDSTVMTGTAAALTHIQSCAHPQMCMH